MPSKIPESVTVTLSGIFSLFVGSEKPSLRQRFGYRPERSNAGVYSSLAEVRSWV